MLGNVIGVLFDGVAYGSLLFIISIGLSVTMGLMNFVNLAHGAFAMLGGYVCRPDEPARCAVPAKRSRRASRCYRLTGRATLTAFTLAGEPSAASSSWLR